MAQFVFLTAADWGMRWARAPVPQALPATEGFWHHTAGSRLENLRDDDGDGIIDEADEAFRRINEMAIGEGMSAIDYTILVHRSPTTGVVTIGEARSEWMPAATKDRNPVSKAVCLMGYFHPGHALSQQPHPDEIEGVALGFARCIEKGWLTPNATILGHRQNPAHPGATACPGDYNMPHLPHVRTRVYELTTAPPPPSGSTYTVLAGDSWWRVSVKLGVSMSSLIAANPPATTATVIHPGQVLNVPGGGAPPPPSKWYPGEPQTASGWVAYGASLPTPPPTLRHGVIDVNVTWWQAVMSSMPRLAADGGGPIYDPEWIAYDRVGSGSPTRNLFGDASKNALAYWQSKNGLTADGVFGPTTASKMIRVRGK